MDYKFTSEQELLRRTIAEFAVNELQPRALEIERSGKIPSDLIKKLGELGVFGIRVPTDYSGSGGGFIERAIIVEELGKYSGAVSAYVFNTYLGIDGILDFGSEDQKDRYLPALARGEKAICVSVTEPIGGSDPLAIRTTAKHVGDEYILNGRKCFASGANIADLFLIVARTGEGTRGLSSFIVEKGMPGLVIGRAEEHAGFRGLDICEIILDNCKLPAENLLGKEGDGLRIALSTITTAGRMGHAALALGLAQGAYEAALKFSKERILYGAPIINLQAIQFMLAEMATKIEAIRWLVYRAAWLLDQGVRGREAAAEIAKAKLLAVDTAREIIINAIKIHGGYGTLSEYHVIRMLKDNLEQLAGGGTQEIMKVIIGRSLTET